MKKLVLTKLNGAKAGIAFDRWESGESKEKACGVCLFPNDTPSLIGNIYIGHVRDVVKNIEAAFVEIDSKTLGYLSLKHGSPVFLGRKNTQKICEGDNIIVQVTKDRIKTKDAVLTTNFSLPGRFAVLTHGKSGIQFSSKIRDDQFKRELKEKLSEFLSSQGIADSYGLIIRTEGYQAEYGELTAELLTLDAQYQELIRLAKTRQKYYLLKESKPPMLEFVKKNLSGGSECEVITDDSSIYEALMEEGLTETYSSCTLRFYEDSLLPLYKLYSLESIFEDIYSRKVWLKSGAYLVIDYTEAMTVIDVNTGKCEKGKSTEHTFLKINMEAALEIARQMRIRNLSGIILVDFIDMPKETDTKKLLEYTRELLKSDPVKAAAVDVTRLHLMEITRQKTTDRIPYIENLFSKKG